MLKKTSTKSGLSIFSLNQFIFMDQSTTNLGIRQRKGPNSQLDCDRLTDVHNCHLDQKSTVLQTNAQTKKKNNSP